MIGIGLPEILVLLVVGIGAALVLRYILRRRNSRITAPAKVQTSNDGGNQAQSHSSASPKQGQVFLSYATPDRDRARQIAGVLESLGWRVWWDRTIPPGREYDEVIESALNSAACVVVLWSKASAVSNWVKAEAAEGLSRHTLVPAKIEETLIPLEFRRFQAANLVEWRGSSTDVEFHNLVNSIAALVALPTKPA